MAQKPSGQQIIYKNLSKSQKYIGAQIGFCVANLSTGEVIGGYQQQKYFTPASVTKIFTTATALHNQGSNYRFRTWVGADGAFNDSTGVLTGDLVVLGSGDPTLGSSFWEQVDAFHSMFARWARQVKDLGIKEIYGDVVVNDFVYPKEDANPYWIWQDMGNYFGAEAYGFNLNQNVYKINFKTGAPGAQALLLNTEPYLPYLKLNSDVIAGPKGSGDQAYIFGSPDCDSRTIKGTLPPYRNSFFIKGSLPQPGLLAAHLFKYYLEKNNITVTGNFLLKHNVVLPSQLTLLFSEDSPRLADIVFKTNQESINIFAESLFRLCGKEKLGIGTVEASKETVAEFCIGLGLNKNDFELYDGCGISPVNYISPQAITTFLSKITTEPWFNDFENSLPVCGVSGTLGGVGTMWPLKGKVKAKTGTLTGVFCLAGYITCKSGQKRAFALMFNKHKDGFLGVRQNAEKVLIEIWRNF